MRALIKVTLKIVVWCAVCLLPVTSIADTPTTHLVAGELTAPIDIATIPDDSGRRLILDQSGFIVILDRDDNLIDTPFLDITDRMLPIREDFEERGLLGMAIHPNYKTNGRLYVTYTAPLADNAPANWSHTRIVSEFTVSTDNTDQMNADSERVLISQDWPSRKHNGGALAFGPDGYLYIGLGDGGGIHGIGPETLNDAYNVPEHLLWWDSTAQDLQSLYGKILRIDIDHGYPGYAIPADNPLVDTLGRNEIYAWGFRNPYRLSFDSDGSNRFYITAVAETFWEAIYRVDQPGNYGWPLKEGSHCFDRTRTLSPPASCDVADRVGDKFPIVDPVVEYANMSVHKDGSTQKIAGVGTAVVGAVILRSDAVPEYQDHLLLADWSSDFRKPSGQLFVAKEEGESAWPITKIGELNTRIVAMVRDTDESIWVMTNDNFGPYGSTGKVYRLAFER